MLDSRKIENLWLFYFLADLAAITASYYAVLLFRFHSVLGDRFFRALNHMFQVGPTGFPGDTYQTFYIISAPRIIPFLTVTICILYALRDLYASRRFIRRRPVAWNVIAANVVALAIFYTYFYLRRNVFHPRSFLGAVIVLNIFLCIWFRSLTDRFLRVVRARFNIDRCRAVLVGQNEDADYINWYMEEMQPNGISVAARVAVDSLHSMSGMLTTLEDTIRKHDADMLLVAEKRLSVNQIMELLQLGERLNIVIKVLSDKLNVLVNQAGMPVDMIHGIPLVHFEIPVLNRNPSLPRRVLTLFLACVVLIMIVPLMILVAVLIKLTSSGPVLFVQERIGVNRKPFRMFKFRTMYDRATELQAQVEEFNESGRGLFKIKDDKRITPVGRVLRRFSLDELPQLINVLRGEMAFVGPRPLPRRDFENYYEEWHYTRHSGIPGLTCLWQVSGRSDLDFHDMCILDVFYLANRNWVLDLKIVLRTCWVVLFAKGAY
jgi:exopolysaccharide biosynthesis polyprenyl glycosylphosphotransferase